MGPTGFLRGEEAGVKCCIVGLKAPLRKLSWNDHQPPKSTPVHIWSLEGAFANFGKGHVGLFRAMFHPYSGLDMLHALTCAHSDSPGMSVQIKVAQIRVNRHAQSQNADQNSKEPTTQQKNNNSNKTESKRENGQPASVCDKPSATLNCRFGWKLAQHLLPKVLVLQAQAVM